MPGCARGAPTPTPTLWSRPDQAPGRSAARENPPRARALCVYGGRVFLWVLPYMGRGRVGELGVCFLMSLLMSLHQRCGILWLAGFGLPPLSPPSLGEGTMLCGLRAWLFTRD